MEHYQISLLIALLQFSNVYVFVKVVWTNIQAVLVGLLLEILERNKNRIFVQKKSSLVVFDKVKLLKWWCFSFFEEIKVVIVKN
jgi:hypothetical protein